VRLKNKLWILSILFCVANAYGQSCDIIVTSVGFGSYDSLVSSPLDTTGDINVTCDNGTSFTIKLNSGQNSGGSFHTRIMTAPSTNKKLKYNLYIDSTRIQVWGDGTGGTYTQMGIGTGILQKYTVFGRIPARQKVSVGSYSDAVTVTVEW
jgi:spore coat protein U-like protein